MSDRSHHESVDCLSYLPSDELSTAGPSKFEVR